MGAAIHGVGKHFVSIELLRDLDRVRQDLPPCPAHRQLARFLDTALDKFDGRYDNPRYLALQQLGLPGAYGSRTRVAPRTAVTGSSPC